MYVCLSIRLYLSFFRSLFSLFLRSFVPLFLSFGLSFLSFCLSFLFKPDQWILPSSFIPLLVRVFVRLFLPSLLKAAFFLSFFQKLIDTSFLISLHRSFVPLFIHSFLRPFLPSFLATFFPKLINGYFFSLLLPTCVRSFFLPSTLPVSFFQSFNRCFIFTCNNATKMWSAWCLFQHIKQRYL